MLKDDQVGGGSLDDGRDLEEGVWRTEGSMAASAVLTSPSTHATCRLSTFHTTTKALFPSPAKILARENVPKEEHRDISEFRDPKLCQRELPPINLNGSGATSHQHPLFISTSPPCSAPLATNAPERCTALSAEGKVSIQCFSTYEARDAYHRSEILSLFPDQDAAGLDKGILGDFGSCTASSMQ